MGFEAPPARPEGQAGRAGRAAARVCAGEGLSVRGLGAPPALPLARAVTPAEGRQLRKRTRRSRRWLCLRRPVPPRLPAPLGALPGSAAPGTREAARPPGTARAQNRRERRHACSLPVPRAAPPRLCGLPGRREQKEPLPSPAARPRPITSPSPRRRAGVPGKQAASPPGPPGLRPRAGDPPGRAAPGTSIFQCLLSAVLIKGPGDAHPPAPTFPPPPPPAPNTHTWDRLLTSESGEGVTARESRAGGGTGGPGREGREGGKGGLVQAATLPRLPSGLLLFSTHFQVDTICRLMSIL